ncbi:hypothetical protein CAJAP_04988 [Camponotus japonicus]
MGKRKRFSIYGTKQCWRAYSDVPERSRDPPPLVGCRRVEARGSSASSIGPARTAAADDRPKREHPRP